MPCTHDVIQSTAQSASIDGCMSRLMVCQIASVRSLAASSPYILFTSSRPSYSPLAPRVISHSVQYLTNNVKPSHLLAPSYLSDPLEFYQPIRTLRSSSESLLYTGHTSASSVIERSTSLLLTHGTIYHAICEHVIHYTSSKDSLKLIYSKDLSSFKFLGFTYLFIYYSEL